jgi:hypothetical protein
MKINDPDEIDWSLFKELVPAVRERFLDEKNTELINILSDPTSTPTECFWACEEALNRTAKALKSCLDSLSRSNMRMNMIQMLQAGILKKSDLEPFSEDLKKRLAPFLP